MVKLVPTRGSSLTLILTEDDLGRSGDVGGWQDSERVLRPPAHWWKSTPGGLMSPPCLLDLDEIDGPSIERRLEVLYAMGQPTHDFDDPPGIRLYGDVDPIAKDRLWKLDDITLGKRNYRPDAPTFLRQQWLTLQISTLTAAKPVGPVRLKATRSKGKRRTRTITAKQGDTLRAIAVRQLGSSGDYTLIRQWNKKLARTDPDAPLRAGTKIVLR